MKYHRLFVSFIACVIGQNSAHAGFVHNSTGMVSPVTTVDFSEIPSLNHGDGVTNQFLIGYGVEFYPSPVFAPPLMLNTTTYATGFNNLLGNVIQTRILPESPAPPPYIIEFAGNVTEAMFAMYTSVGAGANTFEAFDGTTLVASGAVTNDVSNRIDNFYGFSGISFNSIRITLDPTTNGTMVLDNIQRGDFQTASAVPEPTTFAMWSMLGGLGFAVYRRRSSRAGSASVQ